MTDLKIEAINIRIIANKAITEGGKIVTLWNGCWKIKNKKRVNYALNKTKTGKYSWLMYLIIWNDIVYFCINVFNYMKWYCIFLYFVMCIQGVDNYSFVFSLGKWVVLN